ncbi:MAG TPA: hypothetical protein VJN88_06775 [Ktedonobacterales bacterium]|nr:hypothetical protein [Ktedonobacterales bacterium]
MRASSATRRYYGYALLGGVLILSLLTACGASTAGTLGADRGGATTRSSGGTTSVATATTSTGGTGALPSNTVTTTLNGCPVKQAPADAATPTGAVVVNGVSAMEQQVTASQGQAVVVQLKPEMRWVLNIQDPNHTLTPAQPNGWYDAGLNVCVWRFSVVARGNATLYFGGTVVCQAGSVCPKFAVEQDVTVTAN